MFNIFSHQEKQIKTTLKLYLTPARMAFIKKKQNETSSGADTGK